MLSESLDRELSFHQRVGLRMHLLMCKFCSRYQRQLLFLRETVRLYTEHSEDIEPSIKVPSEVRERIKRTVQDILNKPE